MRGDTLLALIEPPNTFFTRTYPNQSTLAQIRSAVITTAEENAAFRSYRFVFHGCHERPSPLLVFSHTRHTRLRPVETGGGHRLTPPPSHTHTPRPAATRRARRGQSGGNAGAAPQQQNPLANAGERAGGRAVAHHSPPRSARVPSKGLTCPPG